MAQFVSANSGQESKLHTILEDDSRLSRFKFHILTKGPDDLAEKAAYTLKKIPMVYRSTPTHGCFYQLLPCFYLA